MNRSWIDAWRRHAAAGSKRRVAPNPARSCAALSGKWPESGIRPLVRASDKTRTTDNRQPTTANHSGMSTGRAVSWIVATEDGSEHPDPSSPAQSAAYTPPVLEALTANPAVWSKTVLLVSFDESDGLFDHRRCFAIIGRGRHGIVARFWPLVGAQAGP
jgi:hypothetical protein